MQASQILIPIDTDAFWRHMRNIIEEVLDKKTQGFIQPASINTKQMLKVKEVCELFQVSKPTVYDWIHQGKLKSLKIESRRFFLASDIEELIAKNRLISND